MKPSSSAGDTTPKSSLNRTIKKTTRPRNKISKPSGITISTPVSVSQETPTTSNTPELLKDKVNLRNYAGFGAKSIKVIWEQHDDSEQDVASDVYPRLAEDVTYKVWELVNNIKTFARHSGGNVTCELVNEVLKDADVPPILGAGDADWDKFEYDETFFYNSDKIVLLRDEYLNCVQGESVICQDIKSSWVIDRRFSKNLVEFISLLCNALFLGDDESYKFAVDTAALSPQIGCSLKLLLKKIVEMIAFEQKSETLDRSLAFLRALSFNPHSRDVECREQLFHLSEVLICLLLGMFEQMLLQKHRKQIKCMPPKEQKEECSEFVKDFLKSSGQEIKKEVEPLNQMNVDDIRSQYQDLYQMMEREGFQECENSEVETKDRNICGVGNVLSKKQEIVEPKNVKQEYQEQLKEKFEEFEMSPYKAEMCDMKYVDTVCLTIGCLGSQFGYLQNECTFLIQKRMERFFYSIGVLEKNDYEFISRCVRGLISLGEYAFREIIPFLSKINPLNAPEWIQNDFSPGAAFLHGRDDIFLYEWLEELCGSKLQPFMIHYYNFHQKFTTKMYKKLRNSTYKINTKVLLKILDKQFSSPKSLHEAFPKALPLKIPSKKIIFRSARCRPVLIKQKANKFEKSCVQEKLVNFDSHIVIGKRKLFKPLSDNKKIIELSNYCFLQI